MLSNPVIRIYRSPSDLGWHHRMQPSKATLPSVMCVRPLCSARITGWGRKARAWRTGLRVIEAQDVLRKLAAAFPTFWEWAQHVIDVGILAGRLSTVFGWPIHVTDNSRPTALRNYPIKANGAEMLRLACCVATELGITICAPIHDALLVEGYIAEINDVIIATRAAMAKASRDVLDGLEIGTDVSVVNYPDRYMDPRGQIMWERVMERIHGAQDERASYGV
jgi:hypothetical protein